MSLGEQHIVGSAEPLTPEQTRARLRELKEWGVDLSLVRESLQQTPQQRLDQILAVLALTLELKRAYQAQYGGGLPVQDQPDTGKAFHT
jgi:hypothetical protein